MPNSSVSNLGNAASPKPSVDAWCVFELNSGSNPTIVDSVGVSSVARLSQGVYRVYFSDPSKFSSGAYVAMVQPELGNSSTGYWNCISHGTTSDSQSNAIGASASSDILIQDFDSNSFSVPTSLKDYSNTSKARVNVAFVCLRNTSNLFTPKNENLVAYSEKMDVWTKSGSTINQTLVQPPNEIPTGVTVWKHIPNSGILVGNSSIVQNTSTTAPLLETGAFYTMSAYVKAGDITTPFVILYLRDKDTYTHAINFTYTFAGSGSITLAGSSWANTKSSVITLNDGWYRVSVTGKWTGTNGAQLEVYFFSGSNLGGNADGTKGNYVTAIQVEKGTVATKYVKTEQTVPVLGNQDSLINLYPSTRGFGVSGSTYSSAITQLNNKRSATAWGTIVIPPISGSTAYPYLQGAYNVSTVVTKGKSVFDLYFKNQMGNTGYCVVTSTEQETVYDETAAVGTQGSIPPTSEYTLNLLRNQSSLDDQRQTDRFSVSSLRQVVSAPIQVVATNGVTQSERLDLWGKNGWMSSVSANTGITSPNEIYGITAWKLVPVSGSTYSSSGIYDGVCVDILTKQNSTYTMSAYVRGGDLPSPGFYNYFRVGANDYAQTGFVLETGIFTNAGVTSGGNWSGLTYGMRSLENGWYRIHTTATWNGASGLTVGVWLYAGTTMGSNSDGTKGVHATAVQFEESAKPSQYTPTQTTAATFGTRVVGGNTSTTNNPFQTTDTSFRGLYTYTAPDGLAGVFWLTWYSRITSGNYWYNLKVDRIRGGAVSNLYSGLYSGFYDDRYDHTVIGNVHTFHPMRVSITGHQNGDIYQVSGVASGNNTTVVSGLTAQQLEIKDFYRVNKNSNFSETSSTYPFQIGDVQKIHFVVFGGLTAYGAS